ncbi:hypothetical protein Daus18300_008021 [Diaporthe australafricana]|uniref:DUF7704 domain-containing protein n=1 Tax=Diaporthe australafricana TaxID=127596 RepID=A0ABR3WK45_9PEZI
MAPQHQQQLAGPSQFPIAYRLFFLYIEPVSALVGAFYAHLRQRDYLLLTHAASAPPLLLQVAGAAPAVPTGTSIVLSQLANLYLLFALNEALVLRSTPDPRVWRAVLFGLLVADLGHLWTVRPLGLGVYLPWNFARWNAIDWGNIPFVYLGASMRAAFLAGVGLGDVGNKAVSAMIGTGAGGTKLEENITDSRWKINDGLANLFVNAAGHMLPSSKTPSGKPVA